MRRLFVEQPLHAEREITLSGDEAHYLAHVLRLGAGAEISVFNGEGGEYPARLCQVAKKTVTLALGNHCATERESPLQLTLVQGIAKSEHMDYLLQKSVELGVQRIVPVLTRYTQHFDLKRGDKRWLHWRKILIAACMQCGRNRLPDLAPAVSLAEWLARKASGPCAMLAPDADQHLRALPVTRTLTLLVGPEGGFHPDELSAAQQAGYHAVGLGPRILRTETAAVAAIAVAQAQWGDLGGGYPR